MSYVNGDRNGRRFFERRVSAINPPPLNRGVVKPVIQITIDGYRSSEANSTNALYLAFSPFLSQSKHRTFLAKSPKESQR